jgi:hypothetical protein
MSSRISARTLAILGLTQCSLFFGLIAQSKITAGIFRRTVDSLSTLQAPDAKLVSLYSSSIDTTGKSDTWWYNYWSDDDTSGYSFYVTGAGTVTFGYAGNALRGGTGMLSVGWIDSDSALAVAQRSGGIDIRRQFPTCTIAATLMNLVSKNPFDTWRIDYICSDGTRTIVVNATNGIVVSVRDNSSPPIPKEFELYQNYPNPFNPSTTISYALPQQSHVTLTVYNVLGQQVATLVNETQNAGFYDVKFDGAGLASGMYFYRLQAGNVVQTKKLLLLK